LMGAPYEDVVLWGSPADAEPFLARGYVADVRRGGVAIMRFSPCGLDVEVAVPEPLGEPLIVQYGWAPLPDKVEAAQWPEGASFPDATARASFPAAPCGPVWVRVAWDKDRSGKAGPRDVFCESADDKGRLWVELGREQHRVGCRPGHGPSAGSGPAE